VTGAWILAIFVAVLSATLLLILHHTGAGEFLHKYIPDTPRRRIMLASTAFFLTFAGVRALTWSIHNNKGPFHDIHMGGRHIHHLVFGIVLLLLVGYGWMIDAGGTDIKGWPLAGRRLLCIFYGSAAALTLDEFALWLNLRDVYWAREGRSSLDAAVLFAAFLVIGIIGRPLWKALVHEFRKA
jgi:hypothetical protein